MEEHELRLAMKRRILKMINRDGIPLIEVSRASGIPIATLVYWQCQAEKNSSDS